MLLKTPEEIQAYEKALKAARFQSRFGQIVYPFFCWVVGATIFWFKIKIENLKFHRRYFAEITKEKYPPLLVCPNHLTFIDSILLIRAFGNHFLYPFQWRKHIWNLAAVDHVQGFVFRMITYISKCLYIDRNADKDHKHVILGVAAKMLQEGEIVMIFPEGKRSRTGRFDDSKLAYGIGKLITELGEARVLCTYLRSPAQGDKPSNFPPRGARYQILYDLRVYKASEWGENPVEAIMRDIAQHMMALEAKYFTSQDAFS